MSEEDLKLAKNAKFSSYSKLYHEIEKYQKKENVTMSRSNSRLINRDGVNEELIYIEISYKCRRAGIYKPKGKGLRKANSNKTNCPAFIDVRVPMNEQYLMITNICLSHNHDQVPAVNQTDKDEQHVQNSTSLGISKESKSTNFTDDLPNRCYEETGQISPNKNDCDNSLMQYQLTDVDLLEITYSVEDLNECASNQDDTNKCDEEINLSASIKNLSVDENKSTRCLENSKLSTDLITSEEHEEKNAIAFSQNSPPAKRAETLEIQDSEQKCALFDVSSLQSAVKVENLDDIEMPNVRSKGRPRGRALMAIGLPIKKASPISFTAQRPVIQAKMILQWIISEETILKHALTGEYLIKEADLPSQHGELPDSIMADEVDMSVVQQYMEKSALRKLKNLVQKKKDSGIWICKICRNNLDERSVLCESCLFWHDYKCVNLRRAPKAKQWYCTSCRR